MSYMLVVYRGVMFTSYFINSHLMLLSDGPGMTECQFSDDISIVVLLINSVV